MTTNGEFPRVSKLDAEALLDENCGGGTVSGSD
jgi:hypothetical protein